MCDPCGRSYQHTDGCAWGQRDPLALGLCSLCVKITVTCSRECFSVPFAFSAFDSLSLNTTLCVVQRGGFQQQLSGVQTASRIFFFCVELGKNCISFPAMKVCSGWLLYVPRPRLPLTHICTLPQLSLTPEIGDTLSQSLHFFSFSSSTGALL